jgi:DNA-binding LacI/PurR family transcriptional regulator
VQQAIEELGYVPDGAAQSLSRRRKDIIGMMCVERETAGEHDVEAECLLYYDEVQRGVQEQIRSSQWLLLSSVIKADRAGEPDLSRLNRLSGKVDGPGAPGQLERHETPDPAHSDAMKPRIQRVRQRTTP